jgi:hypothetical protein
VKVSITLLVILLVRMEVMMEPLAAILVERAITLLGLQVILGMMDKPILELEEMQTVEVTLRMGMGMGRVMAIKLRVVTVGLEVIKLPAGMLVEMLLLALVVITGVTVETPTGVTAGMPMLGMVETAMEMETEGMAEAVTVMQETQTTKPTMKKS